MKSRFLYLAATGLFLLAGCIQKPTGPAGGIGSFDLDMELPADTQSPVLFKKYTVPYKTGKDKFANISAYTVPAGFIDTLFVNQALQAQNGTVTIYFIKAGACTLHIKGTSTDYRSFRDSASVTVRNPFAITGEPRIGVGDPFPSRYSLSPLPSPDSMALHAQTEWSINGTRKALGAVNTPYDFTASDTGTFTLVASFVDTARKISSPLGTLVIHAPGHRPVMDSIALFSPSMIAGDSLRFRLFSGDRDSNLFRIIIQDTKNRWSDTLNLTKGSPYPTILTMDHPLTDTGTFTFSLFAEDSSGLISNAVSGVISVVANPPRIRFIPDKDTLKAAINFPTMLNVTQGAATYVWTVDGIEETGTAPFLQKTFLTPAKKVSTIMVYGIDKYNYKGPVASVVLVEEDHFYDLSWGHIPADSVFRDSAYWEARTSMYDRVTANHARVYWTIQRLPLGDTLYKSSVAGDSVVRLRIASITGINFDSVNIKVSVILKDSLAAINTSPLLEDSTKLRLFRPRMQLVSVTPRSDSVSTGVPFTIKFRASDIVGGRIDSIRWKYTDSAAIKQLLPTDTTITLTWTSAGKPTICIWARDNDGQRSDTLKTTVVVVKNQPRITDVALYPPVVYTNEACTLKVTVQKGFSGSRIDSVRIIGPGLSSVGMPVSNVVKFGTTFTNSGWQKLTVKVYDSLRDSSIRVDSVNIASGKPTVFIRSVSPRSDSISAKVQATFKYTVSTSRTGFIDSVFWKQTGGSTVNGLKVGGSDSTFKYTWTDSGTVTIKIWARDNVGNISDTSTKPIVIVKNRPSIAAFIVPQGTPPTKLSYNYRISARRGFSGARITGYHWVYPSATGTNDSTRTDSTIALSFSTAGQKTISVYVVDSLNDTSARFIDTITIDPGLPVVKSVTIDTSASGNAVFVNDPILVTISAIDTNGTIASYKAVLIKGTDTIPAQLQSCPLTLKVLVGKEGIYSLRVYAQDDDLQWSAAFPATPITINVRAAKPVITAFTPPAGLWIYDMLTFRYSAKDTNGGLAEMIFDWGDGPKKDTVSISPKKDTVLNRAVTHRYMSSGTFAVNVSAVDDDTQSMDSTFTIIIQKGMPTIKATEDTFVIASEFWGDTLSFAANANDPNGTINDKYVWIISPPLDTTAHAPDTLVTTSGVLKVGKFSRLWSDHVRFSLYTTYTGAVYVKDDDGLVAIDIFYFYFDGPRYHFDTAQCKLGYQGNLDRFEVNNGTITGLDSIYIDVGNISKTDTGYLSVKTVMIIDSGWCWNSVFSRYENRFFNDTIVVNNFQKLNIAMQYSDLSQNWHMAYRPLSSIFTPYVASIPRPLYFHLEVSIKNRAGIISTEKAVSGLYAGLHTFLNGM